MCDDIEYVWCQAEDGIRDWTVTGVQTCALPISRIARFRSDRAVLDRAERAQAQYAEQLLARRPDLNLAILAHTHRPALSQLPNGRAYLNPGAFLDGGRYAVITKKNVELKTFH